MSLVAYARVSSTGQNLEAQLEKLKAYGCETFYTEKISGLDQNRPQLQACLKYLRHSDTLVVTRLDRLARSAMHLGQIVETLKEKKVSFVVIDQHIDTTTSMGKLMFQMLSAFAEFENSIRKERQMDGIKNAIKKGKYLGRPKKRNDAIDAGVVESRAAEMSINDIMKKYTISKATVYRILNEHKAKQTEARQRVASA